MAPRVSQRVGGVEPECPGAERECRVTGIVSTETCDGAVVTTNTTGKSHTASGLSEIEEPGVRVRRDASDTRPLLGSSGIRPNASETAADPHDRGYVDLDGFGAAVKPAGAAVGDGGGKGSALAGPGARQPRVLRAAAPDGVMADPDHFTRYVNAEGDIQEAYDGYSRYHARVANNASYMPSVPARSTLGLYSNSVEHSGLRLTPLSLDHKLFDTRWYPREALAGLAALMRGPVGGVPFEDESFESTSYLAGQWEDRGVYGRTEENAGTVTQAAVFDTLGVRTSLPMWPAMWSKAKHGSLAAALVGASTDILEESGSGLLGVLYANKVPSTLMSEEHWDEVTMHTVGVLMENWDAVASWAGGSKPVELKHAKSFSTVLLSAVAQVLHFGPIRYGHKVSSGGVFCVRGLSGLLGWHGSEVGWSGTLMTVRKDAEEDGCPLLVLTKRDISGMAELLEADLLLEEGELICFVPGGVRGGSSGASGTASGKTRFADPGRPDPSRSTGSSAPLPKPRIVTAREGTIAQRVERVPLGISGLPQQGTSGGAGHGRPEGDTDMSVAETILFLNLQTPVDIARWWGGDSGGLFVDSAGGWAHPCDVADVCAETFYSGEWSSAYFAIQANWIEPSRFDRRQLEVRTFIPPRGTRDRDGSLAEEWERSELSRIRKLSEDVWSKVALASVGAAYGSITTPLQVIGLLCCELAKNESGQGVLCVNLECTLPTTNWFCWNVEQFYEWALRERNGTTVMSVILPELEALAKGSEADEALLSYESSVSRALRVAELESEGHAFQSRHYVGEARQRDAMRRAKQHAARRKGKGASGGGTGKAASESEDEESSGAARGVYEGMRSDWGSGGGDDAADVFAEAYSSPGFMSRVEKEADDVAAGKGADEGKEGEEGSAGPGESLLSLDDLMSCVPTSTVYKGKVTVKLPDAHHKPIEFRRSDGDGTLRFVDILVRWFNEGDKRKGKPAVRVVDVKNLFSWGKVSMANGGKLVGQKVMLDSLIIDLPNNVQSILLVAKGLMGAGDVGMGDLMNPGDGGLDMIWSAVTAPATMAMMAGTAALTAVAAPAMLGVVGDIGGAIGEAGRAAAFAAGAAAGLVGPPSVTAGGAPMGLTASDVAVAEVSSAGRGMGVSGGGAGGGSSGPTGPPDSTTGPGMGGGPKQLSLQHVVSALYGKGGMISTEGPTVGRTPGEEAMTMMQWYVLLRQCALDLAEGIIPPPIGAKYANQLTQFGAPTDGYRVSSGYMTDALSLVVRGFFTGRNMKHWSSNPNFERVPESDQVSVLLNLIAGNVDVAMARYELSEHALVVLAALLRLTPTVTEKNGLIGNSTTQDMNTGRYFGRVAQMMELVRSVSGIGFSWAFFRWLYLSVIPNLVPGWVAWNNHSLTSATVLTATAPNQDYTVGYQACYASVFAVTGDMYDLMLGATTRLVGDASWLELAERVAGGAVAVYMLDPEGMTSSDMLAIFTCTPQIVQCLGSSTGNTVQVPAPSGPGSPAGDISIPAYAGYTARPLRVALGNLVNGAEVCEILLVTPSVIVTQGRPSQYPLRNPLGLDLFAPPSLAQSDFTVPAVPAAVTIADVINWSRAALYPGAAVALNPGNSITDAQLAANVGIAYMSASKLLCGIDSRDWRDGHRLALNMVGAWAACHAMSTTNNGYVDVGGGATTDRCVYTASEVFPAVTKFGAGTPDAGRVHFLWNDMNGNAGPSRVTKYFKWWVGVNLEGGFDGVDSVPGVLPFADRLRVWNVPYHGTTPFETRRAVGVYTAKQGLTGYDRAAINPWKFVSAYGAYGGLAVAALSKGMPHCPELLWPQPGYRVDILDSASIPDERISVETLAAFLGSTNVGPEYLALQRLYEFLATCALVPVWWGKNGAGDMSLLSAPSGSPIQSLPPLAYTQSMIASVAYALNPVVSPAGAGSFSVSLFTRKRVYWGDLDMLALYLPGQGRKAASWRLVSPSPDVPRAIAMYGTEFWIMDRERHEDASTRAILDAGSRQLWKIYPSPRIAIPTPVNASFYFGYRLNAADMYYEAQLGSGAGEWQKVTILYARPGRIHTGQVGALPYMGLSTRVIVAGLASSSEIQTLLMTPGNLVGIWPVMKLQPGVTVTTLPREVVAHPMYVAAPPVSAASTYFPSVGGGAFLGDAKTTPVVSRVLSGSTIVPFGSWGPATASDGRSVTGKPAAAP